MQLPSRAQPDALAGCLSIPSKLFLGVLATFPPCALLSFERFIFYAALLALLCCDRQTLKEQVVSAPPIMEGADEDMKGLLNAFYYAKYREFMTFLVPIAKRVKSDLYLSPHYFYFIRSIRLRAYQQYLEPYKSVTIANMAAAFGVSPEFVEEEVAGFIASGKLGCRIDRVNGVVEANRPDARSRLYLQTIKQGDVLLNRIQKLARGFASARIHSKLAQTRRAFVWKEAFCLACMLEGPVRASQKEGPPPRASFNGRTLARSSRLCVLVLLLSSLGAVSAGCRGSQTSRRTPVCAHSSVSRVVEGSRMLPSTTDKLPLPARHIPGFLHAHGCLPEELQRLEPRVFSPLFSASQKHRLHSALDAHSLQDGVSLDDLSDGSSGNCSTPRGGPPGPPDSFLQPMDVSRLVENMDAMSCLLKRRGAAKEVQDALEAIPASSKAEVEPGCGATCNKELRCYIPPGGLLQRTPEGHLELLASLEALENFEDAAKVGGRRRSALEGTGQLPHLEAEAFRLDQRHLAAGETMYLSPTAEVPLIGLYSCLMLPLFMGPPPLCLEKGYPFSAWSPSLGGLASVLDLLVLQQLHAPQTPAAPQAGRNHPLLSRTFYKTELAAVCTPEDSETLHWAFLQHVEQMLQELELPYRVVQLCDGEMGNAAALCFDVEVWMPALGRFLEVSSISNCRDYQARRLNIRFKDARVSATKQQQQGQHDGVRQQKQRPQYCHTLNASALAVGRTLAALVENHKRLMPNGELAIRLPPPLRPYFKGATFVTKDD
ncbi:26s proteasome regulatory complex [Cyclospora cayetanensis]|uniref:serine--tRNA ligase n=1 Tax=Cyclospora cayetanensis TaxID=88456 RepID=A0A1D3CRH7_9EIME|nr:26s proteasome regulatory complex [Cyclospora cayetanensis]